MILFVFLFAMAGCSEKDESALDQFLNNQKNTFVNYGFTGYDGTKYAYTISRSEQGYSYRKTVDQKESSSGVCKYFDKSPGDDGTDYTLSECAGTDAMLTVAFLPRNP